MEVDMETSPSYFDPEDLSTRERYRRYGYSLKSCKHEDDALSDGGDTTFTLFASLLDSALQGLMPIPDLILQFERSCRNVSESIRMKIGGGQIREEEVSFLVYKERSNEKGNEELPEDMMLSPTTSHLEACQFVVADHTAQLGLRIVQWLEALASKVLDLDNESPTTSHLEACQFVVADHTAQLGLWIVQWLEGLASKVLDLDNEVRGSHVGTYLPSSGVWRHTQRALKKGVSKPKTVHHLDFDAPTREHAEQLPDDKKQDESLLEDIWSLLRAGRLEEACDLCRSAGQPWRAATLCPFGGLDLCPSVEALVKNGKNRTLQAIELESGIGHQWRLWKWATYCVSERIAEQDGGKYETAVYAAQCSNLKRILLICTDWESASWAMVKSWLDVQVDLELARLQPGGMDQFKTYEDAIDRSHGQGDTTQYMKLLLKNARSSTDKLKSIVHSLDYLCISFLAFMNLMMGDIPHQLDVMWSWISPSEDEENVFRYLLVEQMKGAFKEKIMTVGDLILHMYAIFLFSKHHEELVGIYASQLAHHRCIDLFVHMMELRLNSSDNVTVPRFSQLNYVSKIIRVVIKEVVHVKYKIFLSAIENLPFSAGDDSKGIFEEIFERVLSRSREIKPGKYDKSSDVAEQHRLQSLQKAMVIQWLCFTPPSTINDAQASSAKLLLRALLHRSCMGRYDILGGVSRHVAGESERSMSPLVKPSQVETWPKVFRPAPSSDPIADDMEAYGSGRTRGSLVRGSRRGEGVEGSGMVCLKSLSKTVRRQVETWPKVFRPAPSSDPIADDMEVDRSGRTRGNLVRGSRRGEGVEGSGDRFGDVVEVGGRPRDRGIKMILNGPQMEHDGPSKILGSSDLLHVGQEFNYQKPISVFPRDGPFSKQYKEYNGGPNRSDELSSNELGPVGYMNGAHILEEGIRAESQPLGAEVRPDLIEDEGQPLGEEIQLGLADRVDDSVEGELRLAAEVDEWVNERIEEENDAELLSQKVDEGCFEPTEVLQALNIYGSGSEESSEYDSGSGCEEEDQEESDLELINLFTEKDNVEEDETENDIIKEDEIEVSETMDHCLGLKCSVRGRDDRGVTPDISRAMRDVPITNPVSYNANINAGQVNDAQEGASVMNLHRRGCVFSSLRDSEVETERWLMELSKYASCPIEENEVPHFKHLLQVMGLPLYVERERERARGTPHALKCGMIGVDLQILEFALISMWRVPAMPISAHTLLSFLAEPLKQPTETLLSTEDHDVSENLREFQDWSEYYSCDATYRNWLKVELESVEVSPLELSIEEKQRAIAAAKETLNSSFSLLLRKENPWLVLTEDRVYESVEPLFLELHAIAMLYLPSGECMCPDATLCATLMSALYSSVSEEVVLNRQLMVCCFLLSCHMIQRDRSQMKWLMPQRIKGYASPRVKPQGVGLEAKPWVLEVCSLQGSGIETSEVSVSISSTDNYCIEVVLRCLATDGDGLGPHELNDGGIIATVIAAGFKGELVRFQAGITMEISRLDAWYSSKDGSLEAPATYIVRGLCRRCCIPEVILRCMQISISLVESGNPHESHDELIELVALPETGFLHLFSQQQLQEFLLLEREYCICKLELGDELPC
ncbi:hypothetical protein TEA_006177 [Camellia sinensis var. sinensis]|uniref:Nuclear pore complex protein n=1 Tax=Camellia sinensis var. sinensis TaxID=542762 RepID=A0A4S4DXP5_CAMSN|nr:hypothetical protein TEA_006177 [Camellia sinensis var. sinensis]